MQINYATCTAFLCRCYIYIMEYHGTAEKNVRPDCIDMGGGHKILIEKGTLQNNMSNLISLKNTKFVYQFLYVPKKSSRIFNKV